MRICFIGHSFHARTGSSAFFVEFLKTLGEVVQVSVNPDAPPLVNDAAIRGLVNSKFDRYVFWQSEWVAERVPLDLGASFIVPMYDAARYHPASYWKRFVKFHFLSFSRALHETLQSTGCTSDYFQYFPEAQPSQERLFDDETPSAFFWERRPLEPLSLPLVQNQCRQLGIGKLYLHAVPDFVGDDQARSSGQVGDLNVQVSNWHEDRQSAMAVAAKPTFFFAPRSTEGIGMATLEAMACGQIVVAPDLPTANEYLAHRTTGLLYDPAAPLDPLSLPLLDAAMRRRIGEAARRKVVRGRETWIRDTDRLRSLILGDGRRWPTSDASAGFADAIRNAAHQSRTNASR